MSVRTIWALIASLNILMATTEAAALNSCAQFHLKIAVWPQGFKLKKAESIDAVSTLRLRPLQRFVGKAMVNAKFLEMEVEAKLVAKSESPKDVRQAILEIAQRESSSGLHAFLDPDGIVRPSDGHHKIGAIRKIIEKYELEEREIKIKVKIREEDDFRDRSWDDFAAYLETLGFALPEAARVGETAGERLQRLPRSFDVMPDSPIRSAVGHLFETLGLKGSQFLPMVQFELASAFQGLGVQVQSGAEFAPFIQGRLLDELFQGSRAQALQSIILKQARSEQAALVQGLLANGQYRYRSIREAIRRGFELDSESFDTLDIENGRSADDPNSSGVSAQVAFVLKDMNLQAPRVLPNQLELPRESLIFDQLQNTAKEQIQAANPRQVRVLLKKISKGQIDDLSRGEKRLLKSARKALLKLRSILRFHSDETQASNRLRDFSTTLGQLNDQIRRHDSNRLKRKKDLVNLADELLRQWEDDPKLLQPDTVTISGTDFKTYNLVLLPRIERILIDQSMTVDQYHWLRRRVRDYSNLFELMLTAKGDPATDLMANMMSSLSRQMGKFKDGMTNSNQADKFENPGNRPTQLDPISDKLIHRFLEIMKRSMHP